MDAWYMQSGLRYIPGLRYLGLGYLIYAIWAKVPGLRYVGLGT